MDAPRSGCPINLTLDGWRWSAASGRHTWSHMFTVSLTEEFEKILLVSEDGHVASVTG